MHECLFHRPFLLLATFAEECERHSIALLAFRLEYPIYSPSIVLFITMPKLSESIWSDSFGIGV